MLRVAVNTFGQAHICFFLLLLHNVLVYFPCSLAFCFKIHRNHLSLAPYVNMSLPHCISDNHAQHWLYAHKSNTISIRLMMIIILNIPISLQHDDLGAFVYVRHCYSRFGLLTSGLSFESRKLTFGACMCCAQPNVLISIFAVYLSV